jgi:uncharacterized OsmC-like protein
MEYKVVAYRKDASGSLARAKQAELLLGTDLAGREDAFNPVELLLAALAACMIKGVERVKPLLAFEVEGVEVRLQAIRQEAPPKLLRIDYEILVDSPETTARLDLLHRNVLKYGTISNTLAGALELVGSLRRA